jgi:hypothetical protein
VEPEPELEGVELDEDVSLFPPPSVEEDELSPEEVDPSPPLPRFLPALA